MPVLSCCGCVCYMGVFGSKVRPRSFGCVATGDVNTHSHTDDHIGQQIADVIRDGNRVTTQT